MSRDYLFMCLDCLVYIYCGKVYCFDENGNPLDDYTFQGIFGMRSKNWHKRDEYFGRVIEKFLILHRNHELRFVPEGVDEFLEDDLGFTNDVEGDDLLEEKVEPEVDWWKEKEVWQEKLGK